MKVVAIIKCDSCCTLEEHVLKEGVNQISPCRCGNYFGDNGGKVTVEIDRSYE